MSKQQTAQEKLISDRQQIQAKCAIQKQKLNEDFSYIQENLGSLFLSGVSSLLFSSSKEKKNQLFHVANLISVRIYIYRK